MTPPARRSEPGLSRLDASRLKLPALIFLGLIASLWLTAEAWGIDGRGEGTPEFYQLFEGASALSPGLKLFGIKPEQHIQFDSEGLQLTLPTGYLRQRPGCGVATTFGIKGDFEITASYEILREDRKAENPDLYTSLNLDVIPARPTGNDPEQFVKPSQNRAGIGRALWVRERTMFLTTSTQWDGAAAKEEVTRKEFPTTTKAGRLRLSRTGPMLSFLVSETPDGEFILLNRESFGQTDIRQVRFVATTSGVSASLTVRLHDLRIRADSLMRAATPSSPMKAWGKTAAILTAVMVGFPLVVWILARTFRAKKLPAPPPEEEPSKALSFPCPNCNKPFKTRAEFAGKKVKCRHCGEVSIIPREQLD